VVAEAEKMIPDSKQRLEAGLTDLKSLVVWSCSCRVDFIGGGRARDSWRQKDGGGGGH
jgi:hypothetical protein